MPSYDLHQHLWPPQLVEALRRRTDVPRLRGARLELEDGAWDENLAAHELPTRLALLDREGTDVAVVSLAPTLGVYGLPELVDAYHEGISEMIGSAGGRIAAFSAGRLLDGFAGVSLSARDLLSDFDGVAPVLAEAEDAGAAVFVHPGPAAPRAGTPPWWGAVVDYTAQQQAAYALWLARGLDEYPDLRVVFAILAGGAPFQLERLHARGGDATRTSSPNIFLETASYGRLALELCVGAVGARQLVYGTDVPVMDPAPASKAIRSLGEAILRAAREETPRALLR